jgi:hypothetical protein
MSFLGCKRAACTVTYDITRARAGFALMKALRLSQVMGPISVKHMSAAHSTHEKTNKILFDWAWPHTFLVFRFGQFVCMRSRLTMHATACRRLCASFSPLTAHICFRLLANFTSQAPWLLDVRSSLARRCCLCC